MNRHVTITQKYLNLGKTQLEAVYVFLAATRVAVYDMQMQIGKRLLIAKITEKEKARNYYEKAK